MQWWKTLLTYLPSSTTCFVSNSGRPGTLRCIRQGCPLQLKLETSVCFPKFGSLFFIQACPLPPPEHAFAVIAPGLTPTTSTVDINAYLCAHGHIHEAMLRKTTEKTGIILEGKQHEWKGFSITNGLRKPILRSTHIRAGTKFGRVFFYWSGPKQVESKGRNWYDVRDDRG